MDKDNSGGWKKHDDSSKKPTVNYINITRRPEGGIVNVEMKRQSGPSDNLRSITTRGSSLPSSFADLTDPIALFDNSARLKSLLRQHQQKFGSSGFSITSSSDSPVNKDSEGTKLVINPPPLPAHSERHGAGPYHVVIHHPRSQSTESVVVNTSQEGGASKSLSAPRSSSTSSMSVLETKFPSLRAVSPFGQRSFLISSPLFGEGGTRLSLFDRFNEHAPPSFFDSRLRSASNPESLHVTKMTVVRDGNQKVHNIPIKIEGRDSKTNKSGKPSVVYKIPINLVPKRAEADDKSSQQPPLPVQVSTKPRGISIPIITHRATPSDAEQKLAALTKQLEDEMRSTGVSRAPTIRSPEVQPPVKAAVQTSSTNEPLPEVVFAAVPSKDTRPPVEEEVKVAPEAKSSPTELEGQKKKPDLVIEASEVLERKFDAAEEDKKAETAEEIEDGIEDQNFGVCVKCCKDVTSDACKALGKLYHAGCFQCFLCNKMLKGKSFFDVEGTIYCDDDFMKAGYRRIAGNCHACGSCVSDLVLQAVGRTYHPKCFLCCQCSKGLENEAFAVDASDRVFCIEDYYQTYSCKCHVCEKVILPSNEENELVRVLVKGKYYHLECLKCQKCCSSLNSEERCFLSGNDIICKGCHVAS